MYYFYPNPLVYLVQSWIDSLKLKNIVDNLLMFELNWFCLVLNIFMNKNMWFYLHKFRETMQAENCNIKDDDDDLKFAHVPSDLDTPPCVFIADGHALYL